MRFTLFIQKTANILVGCVRIGIDGHVGDILVNKTIDEIRKVQLRFVETVQVLEIFTIALIECGHTDEQLSAASEAEMYICGQAAGSVTIAANGAVPTCDIPVVVILLG